MNAAIDWGSFSPDIRKDARSAVAGLGRVLSAAPILSGIKDDDSYESGLALYEQIIAELPDEGETAALDGELGALALFEDLLGRALAEYAENRWPLEQPSGGSPAALIRIIMDEHDLTQSEIPEIGSQGVVSEILNGKRELNLRQINALSAKFGIQKSYFL